MRVARVDQVGEHGDLDIPFALRARLNWIPSRLEVEPVSQADSLTAVRLLLDAGGLHGHKYAIDALAAAMALRSPAPALVLTADRDDWSKLCGDRVGIVDV